MPEENDSNIHIKKVKGNVIISNNQSGGVTAHDNYANTPSPKTKPFYKKIFFWLGVLGTILTILGYFGVVYKSEAKKQLISKSTSKKPNIKVGSNNAVKTPSLSDEPKYKKTHLKKKNMPNSESGNPLSVKNVKGDVVISQNQTGGITAHTVIQQYGKPESAPRHLSLEDQQRLNELSSNLAISIWVSMKDSEANSYGGEIINYLKSKGHSVEINGYMQLYSGGNNPRFDITSTGTSFSISVPVQ